VEQSIGNHPEHRKNAIALPLALESYGNGYGDTSEYPDSPGNQICQADRFGFVSEGYQA